MWGISWLAEELLASQEGLCFIKLVTYVVVYSLKMVWYEPKHVAMIVLTTKTYVWGCLRVVVRIQRKAMGHIKTRTHLPPAGTKLMNSQPKHIYHKNKPKRRWVLKGPRTSIGINVKHAFSVCYWETVFISVCFNVSSLFTDGSPLSVDSHHPELRVTLKAWIIFEKQTTLHCSRVLFRSTWLKSKFMNTQGRENRNPLFALLLEQAHNLAVSRLTDSIERCSTWKENIQANKKYPGF